MDPISITTSVICFVGACRKLAAGFRFLKDLRRAPEEVLALAEELEDLQNTLMAVGLVTRKRKDDFLRVLLQPLFRRVDMIFDELCILCGACSRRLKEEEDYVDHLKIQLLARFKWTRAKNRVSDLRERLKIVRLDIGNQLATVSLLDISNLTSDFQRLSTEVRSTLPDQHSALPAYQLEDSSTMRVSMAAGKELDLEAQSQKHNISQKDTKTSRKVSTVKPSGLCKRACTCVCHSVYRLKSPSLLQNVLGSLLIKSNGVYGLAQPCNEFSCRRSPSANIRISYRFPEWFLNRMISSVVTTNRVNGPQLSLVAPRIVSNTSDIFTHAFAGNIDGISRLFELGLASPYDVNVTWGYTPLHYAVDKGNMELCHFLLKAGARPEITDLDENSVTDLAWNRICSKKIPPAEAMELEEMFKKDDWVEERQFSIIHKIVLGLLSPPRNLDQELATSSRDIDLPDSEGRTPLSWAAECGNISDLETLLRYNASTSSKSITGMTPLHYATKAPTPTCISLLLEHDACVSAHNKWSQSPLNLTSYFQNDPAYLSPLVQYGANVNERDHYKNGPLGCAVFMNHVESARYLISQGAHVNNQDPQSLVVLNDSIENNSHDSIRLLLDSGADLSKADCYGETALHVLARRADARTLKIFMETAHLDDMDVDARTKEGFSVEDVFGQRVAVSDEVDVAFRQLMAKLERKNGSIDFYDCLEKVHPTLPVFPLTKEKAPNVIEVRVEEVFAE